jgi:hypothetical protein
MIATAVVAKFMLPHQHRNHLQNVISVKILPMSKKKKNTNIEKKKIKLKRTSKKQTIFWMNFHVKRSLAIPR